MPVTTVRAGASLAGKDPSDASSTGSNGPFPSIRATAHLTPSAGLQHSGGTARGFSASAQSDGGLVWRRSHVRPLNFAEPPLEKPALAVVGDQGERARVALCRFLRGSEPPQQVRPGGMQQVVGV